MKSNAMTKVAVIIPSYNHGVFLKERLDSLARQTFTDWEAIIIDDTSTDDSVSILREFLQSHPEVKVKHFIVNPTNSGSGYKSWQKGIALATAPYIWIAETDDYSELSFLEETVNILEKNNSLALVFSASNYVDENSLFLYDSRKRTLSLETPEDSFKIIKNHEILSSFPFNPFITNGSSVVFRNPIDSVPDVLFTNKQMSDLFLWSWLIQNQDVAFLNKRLNNFRRHPESTTTKISLYQREILYKEFVIYLNLYPSEKKEKILFSKFIKEYWVPRLKKCAFGLHPLVDLKKHNFFSLRMQFIGQLFRFVLSKLYLKT